MFNPHTKLDVPTITCNEDIKGNAKCKNSRFEQPFDGLRGNAQGSSLARLKAHCRLPINDNRTFSLAITAEALLSEICRNQHFLEGWITLSKNFRYTMTSPAISLGKCSYNFAAGSVYTKKLCSRLLSTEVEFYWQKQQKRVLYYPLGT